MKPLTRKQWIAVGVTLAVVVVAIVLGVVFGLRARSAVTTAAMLPPPVLLKSPPQPDLRHNVRAAVAAAFAAKPPKNFPIDAVATWVDGSDEGWRARVARAFQQERRASPTVVHAAAREPMRIPAGGSLHDELYFNVHLAAAHMPWLRTYFVVTERPQRPGWWPASGRVGSVELKLVHHDQIVCAPYTALPTYNSAAIQTWLHNVPGLAEHFVLFDDDFFVGRPLARNNFFTAAGEPVTAMHAMNMAAIPKQQQQQSLWNRICINTRAMALAAAGDAKPMVVPPHTCVPIVKSLYAQMLTRWFPYETGAFKRFRSPDTDFTPQYVHLAILSLLGRVKSPRTPVRTWFHFGGGFAPALRAAHGELPHMFCINDSITEEERALLDGIVDGLKQHEPKWRLPHK